MHKKDIYTCLIGHLPSPHSLALKDANKVISGFKGVSIEILPNSFFLENANNRMYTVQNHFH